MFSASILLNNNNYYNDSAPKLCSNPNHTISLSDSIKDENNSFVFFSEGQKMLSIIEELQKQSPSQTSINCSNDRISGYFCLDTTFNLSNMILTNDDIKVLEKGLNKTNESELKKDFDKFFEKMKLKWHFCNELTSY